MKKTMFMTIVALSAMLVACNKPIAQNEEKEVAIGQKSEAIASLRVAYDLAKYGYEKESATALVEAANIIVGVPREALEAEISHGEKVADEVAKGSEKDFSPEALLAAAKEIAGDDEIILTLSAKVEAKMAALAEVMAADKKSCGRGAIGGAKCHQDAVNAHSTDYYNITFRGDEFAECVVVGDGDTDLDVYVYDENGNLIDSDIDYSDQCYLSWNPRWTGNFRIKIVNRGNVYNKYVIATN